MFLKLFIFHLFTKCAISSKNILNIASIFETTHVEEIFRNAINEVNSQKDTNFKLNLLRSTITPDDPFYALTETCRHLESGIVGVFGPISSSNVDIVQSICKAKEIPHILTHWTGPLKLGTEVNFFPNAQQLADAYVDIITGFGWEDVTLLYVDPRGLLRLTDFIQKGMKRGLTVYIVNLDSKLVGNYRPILKKLRVSGQRNYLLDQMEELDEVLLQIQQVGMLTDNYNYFLTDLNIDSTTLEHFSYGRANIFGIQLVNPEKDLQQQYPNIYKGFKKETTILGSEAALIIDAIHMFSNTLKELNIIQGTRSLNCNNSKTWSYGTLFINLLKSSTYSGLTGLIQFGDNGYRNVFELNIFELYEGIRTRGSWNSSNGLNLIEAIGESEESIEDGNLNNRLLTVSISLTEPYAMLKRYIEPHFENDRFEGFAIDLIQELALITGFKYKFIVREDRKLGYFDNRTSQWEGMIGDIIRQKADLGIGDITITSEREDVVDFTMPFMTLGISILYRTPTTTLSFFSFAIPFACEVWILAVVACIWVSISTFLLGRISPSEWTNPYPCKNKPEYVESQLNLMNCLWFIAGSITGQHSGVKLRSGATRIIAAVWWFFTFFMVSFYVANLASILIKYGAPVSINLDFSDFHELVENAEERGITFGAKSGGATAHFFKTRAMNYPNSDFAKAWEFMEYHEEAMVTDNQEGIEKAKNERYALFMESSSLQYAVQSNCDLIEIGEYLNTNGYGIAMRKNSPYRSILNMAITKLTASGKIEEIKKKWWKEDQDLLCTSVDETLPIDLNYLGGVFWLTFFGIILAFLLAIAEATLYTFKKARRTKTSLKQAFKEDFKFYFFSRKRVKPTLGKDYSDIVSSTKPEEQELGHLQD